MPPLRLAFALRNALQSELLCVENATNLHAVCIIPLVKYLYTYVLAFHSLALTSRWVICWIHNVTPNQQLVRHTATVLRWWREATNICASMKTFHCYNIIRQFCRTDAASLAWPISRTVENCYENVWTTTGFCDMKNLPKKLSRHETSTNHIHTKLL